MRVLNRVDRILSGQENAMTCMRMNEKIRGPSSVCPSLCKSAGADIRRPERVGTSRRQNNIGPRRLNVDCRGFNVA